MQKARLLPGRQAYRKLGEELHQLQEALQDAGHDAEHNAHDDLPCVLAPIAAVLLPDPAQGKQLSLLPDADPRMVMTLEGRCESSRADGSAPSKQPDHRRSMILKALPILCLPQS